MNNEELKKKILTIVRGAMIEADELPFIETTDNIADALIAAGIGDVSSEKAMRELAEAFYREKCAEYDLLNYQMQKLEYRIAEAEHRAEVAEKERNECERKTEKAQKAGKIIQRDMLRVFGSENPVINDKINALWDLALQQAEREIEENALRQALLTVEEEKEK